MVKQLVYGDYSRAAIWRGVNQLAGAVKVTLGPKGRNVLLGAVEGPPRITKDGATVAREISLEDRFENMGAQMVQEVASKTSDAAGDGTTTATVIAQAIFREGLRMLSAGQNPMDLKRGIDKAVLCAVAEIGRLAKPVTNGDIARVGSISANGDTTIGNLIAEAISRVGNDGFITVEESKGMETSLDVVEGAQFECGYISPYFVNEQHRMEAVMENPLILLYKTKISAMKDVLPLLERVQKAGRPLLIIAEDIGGEALATLVVNYLRGTLKAVAVKAPSFGNLRAEMLDDIAILTGSKVIVEDLGVKLENLKPEDLGSAKKVIVGKDKMVIIEGAAQPGQVERRVRHLRAQLKLESSMPEYEALQARLIKLIGCVAVLKVGAATETELTEKKSRVEDAVRATRAAIAEGIVPGGGVSFIRARLALDKMDLVTDEDIPGIEIVGRALEEPLWQIAQNAGREGSVIVNAVVSRNKPNYGFNAETEQFGDMVKMGVMDSAMVARLALQNAASVAGMMLTTDALIAEEETKAGPATRPLDLTRMRGEPQYSSYRFQRRIAKPFPIQVGDMISNKAYDRGARDAAKLTELDSAEPAASPRTFYFMLEGERARGDMVEYGAEVELVFNYDFAPTEALVKLRGQALAEAMKEEVNLEVSVLADGFEFVDGRWYQVARLRGGRLEEPLRFRLRASAEQVEESGFFVVLSVKGSVLYQFPIPIRLVKKLGAKKSLRPTWELNLDLVEVASEKRRVEEAFGVLQK